MATLDTSLVTTQTNGYITFGDDGQADNELMVGGTLVTGVVTGTVVGGEHVYDNQQFLDALKGGPDGKSPIMGVQTASDIKGVTLVAAGTGVLNSAMLVTNEGTLKVNATNSSQKLLFGSADDNTLTGMKTGGAVIYGMDGADTIKGKGTTANLFHGNEGNDKLTASKGGDTLYGDAGNDKLIGGKGADLLHGGTGADNINGGAGNDKIYGEAGRDTLKGGSGDDSFYFSLKDGKQADVITDFSKKAGQDKIILTDGQEVALKSGSTTALNVVYDKAQKGVVVTLKDGSTILLKGLKEADVAHIKQTTSGDDKIVDWS